VRIIVCVKQVPDTAADRGFHPDGGTDRDSVDPVLCELDEYAIEQALRIADSGVDPEITFLTMGPTGAGEALRKALAMGGSRAVHVCDERLRGTDAPGTALVLAAAIERTGFDLVLCGMAATDGMMGVVPAMLAERLGVPAVTGLDEMLVAGGTVTGVRENDDATERVQAALPAVVSVTDRSGDARYPSFRGIMAAKKKPLERIGLDELGIAPERIGRSGAGSTVDRTIRRPARAQGEIVADAGEGGRRLAAFLATAKFV
jgi:electron transfer flavoprotein beta subunit